MRILQELTAYFPMNAKASAHFTRMLESFQLPQPDGIAYWKNLVFDAGIFQHR